MSTAPTAADVASDAIDLRGATCGQLDMLAATLRAIRTTYPEAVASLSKSVRCDLMDCRHLSDLGLYALSDWREYLEAQAKELEAQLDYAREVGHA